MLSLFFGERLCVVVYWRGWRHIADRYYWSTVNDVSHSRWPTIYFGAGKACTGPGQPGRWGVEVMR